MSGIRRTQRREPVYGEQGNRLLNMSRQYASDPFFQSVSWLLKMEGTNGSVTFTDSSKFNRLAIAYGAAQISTTQKLSGFASGSFSSGNSNIRTTATADLQLSGDFTIETWVYPNSTADMQLASSSSTINTQIFRLNENNVSGRLTLYDGSSYVFQSIAAGITANSWKHLAFARTGTITRAFVNGSQVAMNTTWSGTLRCDIVGSGWLSGGILWTNAYIDEFRVTKGVCRYVDNFTPPDFCPVY